VLGGALLGETRGDHQDFFDVAGLLGGAPGRAPAGAFAHGEGVPRFAGAETVDRAGGKVAEHLRGWHDDGAHVLLGHEARGEQPVAQQQPVRGKRKDDAECQRLPAAALAGGGAECRGVAHAGVAQGAGERDRVAVEIQDERGEDVARRAAEAELGGPEHRRERMGRVEFAVDDFFADGGPADFAAELDAEAVPGEETELFGDREGRGVRQRKKPHAHRARAGGGGGSSG